MLSSYVYFVEVCIALFLYQIPVFLCVFVVSTKNIRRQESDTKTEQGTLQQTHLRRLESDTKSEQYTLQQKHIRRQESDTKTEQYTLQQNT
jgi:1,4-dihydroxy-2-naphthoate octaprenyltransferase